MQLVQVSLRVKPEKAAEYEAAFQSLRTATLANEPGCPFFELHKDPNDPLHYTVFEAYAGPDAVAAHVAAPYYAPHANIFVECLEGDHMAEIKRLGLTGRDMYSVVKGVDFTRYDLLP